jgi:hypothetical protein
MKARAQTDDTENMIKQNIKEALLQGDSSRSQRAYNVWKEYANKADSIIEKFIKSCNKNNTQEFKRRVLIYSVMNSNPTLTFSNGKYKGEEKGGDTNGLGAYYWYSEDFYFGEWKGGKLTGYGIYMNLDGSIYVGKFSNSKRSGKGTDYEKTGKLLYHGEYKDNEPVETYPSTGNYSTYKFTIHNNGDDIYMGETKDNKRHGIGIYLWKDGDMWYGEWKEGIRDGYGIDIYNDGTLKTGTWKDNKYTP